MAPVAVAPEEAKVLTDLTAGEFSDIVSDILDGELEKNFRTKEGEVVVSHLSAPKVIITEGIVKESWAAAEGQLYARRSDDTEVTRDISDTLYDIMQIVGLA